MLRVLIVSFIILFNWHCSDSSNPLTTDNYSYNKNIKIEVTGSSYNNNSNFLMVTGVLTNTSRDTFYASLGERVPIIFDSNKATIIRGSDGYVEQNTPNTGWQKLMLSISREGTGIIKILPFKDYPLEAYAITDSTNTGECRIRIEYYRSINQRTDTLRDVSRTFNLTETYP